MAGDITTNMGVTGLSEYKRAMGEAKEAVKTLDTELKLNEEQLKATGDKEEYMKEKARLLKEQIDAQKKVVDSAKEALEQMKKKGVDESSKSFQKMKQEVNNSTTKLTAMKTELGKVESGAENATKKTEAMNTELQKVGKEIAWQNVSDGLHKITTSLQNGARAAVNFGKKLVSSAKGATGYADEIKTIVAQYEDMGLTSDRYQRMKNVEEFIDTPVEAILTAQQRMQRAASKAGGKKTLEEVLGINLTGQNADDLFWEIGDALLNMSDSFDKEGAAQTMFGRSWRELMPLFKAGREEYERALSEQNVLTDEQVDKLAQADDAIKSVEQEIELLKRQFWADNADKITDLMEWIVDNKDSIVTALEAIGIAFGAMKIGEFAVNIGQTVNGMKELLGLGGGGGRTPTGGAGGGGGGGFVKGLTGKAAAAVKTGVAANGLWALAPAALVTAALKTSVDATNAANEDVWKAQQSRLSGAYGLGGADADFVIRAANAIGLKTDANGNAVTGFMGMTSTNATGSSVTALLDELGRRSDEDKALLLAMIAGGNYNNTLGNDTARMLQRYWEGEGFDMTELTSLLGNVVDSILQGGSAEGKSAPGTLADVMRQAYEDYYNALYVTHDALAEQQAKDTINDLLTNSQWADQWDELPSDMKWALEDALKEGYGSDIMSAMQAAADELSTLPAEVASAVENANITVVVPSDGGYANGLFSVPWDGFHAILHKGERVLPAREAAGSRSYSSNLYVESMYMNNGQDAEGLAAAMAAAQRRTMSGYGS